MFIFIWDGGCRNRCHNRLPIDGFTRVTAKIPISNQIVFIIIFIWDGGCRSKRAYERTIDGFTRVTAKFPFHSFNPKLFNVILINLCSSQRAWERTEKDKEGRQYQLIIYYFTHLILNCSISLWLGYVSVNGRRRGQGRRRRRWKIEDQSAIN